MYVDHPGSLNQSNMENEIPIDEHMKAKNQVVLTSHQWS